MAETTPIRIVRHATLGSTNDEALRLAREGETGPLVVTAESQTGGRGRHGRVWSSPPGNLYASVLISDAAPLSVLPQLGFVAGVALAKAVRGMLGGDPRLGLKWPNDLLYDGAKLAGLLLETTTLPSGRIACVAGFGVNCLWHPEGLAYPATHLAEAAGRPVEPGDVLAALLPELIEAVAIWDRGRGFQTIRAAWLALATGVGDIITVKSFSRVVSGRFSGLDEAGRLLLETALGPITIDAGDVFLHAPPSPNV